MGQARLRGSFQDRVLAAYNKKVNCVGLRAKTLEEIANEAGVPTDSIGKGYLIYETFAQTSDHLSTPISNSTKNWNWC